MRQPFWEQPSYLQRLRAGGAWTAPPDLEGWRSKYAPGRIATWRTRRRRLVAVAALSAVAAGSAVLYFLPSFWRFGPSILP